jgi:hypothetical protein
MTPQEFHDACHYACLQCPQFPGYDDDQMFMGADTPFGDIPKKGMYAVYQFWKDDALLMERGYFNALPEEVKDIFNRIEKVIAAAIEKEFRW